MSVDAVIARITEIQQLSAPRAPAPPAAASFATQLAGASSTGTAGLGTPTGAAASFLPAGLPPGLAGVGGLPGAGGVPAGTPGAALVAAAAGEVGVAEQPDGSNDSPRIAQYRSAMPGNPGVGPWCAYFTSWVAQQAGTPLGEQGQGFASVDAVYAWAQRTGRAVPNGQVAPVRPQPGDLIVWDEHMGVVESVAADGTVHTIEGNSSNMVARRTHAAGSALGYVRLAG